MSEELEKPPLLRLAASSIVLHGEDLLLTVCFFCKLLLSKSCSFNFFVWLIVYIPFTRDGVDVHIVVHFLALKTTGMYFSSLVLTKGRYVVALDARWCTMAHSLHLSIHFEQNDV